MRLLHASYWICLQCERDKQKSRPYQAGFSWFYAFCIGFCRRRIVLLGTQCGRMLWPSVCTKLRRATDKREVSVQHSNEHFDWQTSLSELHFQLARCFQRRQRKVTYLFFLIIFLLKIQIFKNRRFFLWRIDGNGLNKCSCTQQETQPWLEIDLGRIAIIDSIVLWNRTDVPQDKNLPRDQYTSRLFPVRQIILLPQIVIVIIVAELNSFPPSCSIFKIALSYTFVITIFYLSYLNNHCNLSLGIILRIRLRLRCIVIIFIVILSILFLFSNLRKWTAIKTF